MRNSLFFLSLITLFFQSPLHGNNDVTELVEDTAPAVVNITSKREVSLGANNYFRGIPEDGTSESVKFDLEDEITKTCKSFAVNNFKQEKNLIDAIKQNCRKIIREKTGKRPFTNVNIARV